MSAFLFAKSSVFFQLFARLIFCLILFFKNAMNKFPWSLLKLFRNLYLMKEINGKHFRFNEEKLLKCRFFIHLELPHNHDKKSNDYLFRILNKFALIKFFIKPPKGHFNQCTFSSVALLRSRNPALNKLYRVIL